MTVSFDRARVHESAERLRDRRLRLAPPVRNAIALGRGWRPAQREMAQVVETPPTDIAGVLTKLVAVQEILISLPPTRDANRVAAFNALYHRITDRVANLLPTPDVTEPRFLELLDVEFAKRYFDALRLWGKSDAATPDAWEVLFRRAQDRRLSRLAAAMLGVNAHINHDLALALIATWKQLGPPADGVTHPDYLLINRIFFEEIPTLRRSYSTPWQLTIDGLVGTLDDWSQRVLVAATRAWAWEQAERLWPLRDNDDDFEQARLTMDRAAAYVGETLIVGDGLLAALGAKVGPIGAALRKAAVRLLRRPARVPT
jgi:hypothetical protein